MFKSLDELVDAARGLGAAARIAVAAGHDPDAIAALKQAEDMGLARGMFIGNSKKIRAMAEEAGATLTDDQVVDEPDEALAARKAIGMIRNGEAELLMKGKIGTAGLIRAVLDKEAGLRKRLLSQVAVFELPGFNRLMMMTDAAINILPSIEQKADICRNAIAVAHAIGISNPHLAALSALETVNPEMPSTVDAAALTMMNKRGQITGAVIDGPIAMDAPFSRFAAERKGFDSPLVENTDILVVPNIEAGNILYRAIIFFGKGQTCGVVMGAKVPVILLSRAEDPQTKIRSIALGILVSADERKKSK